MNPWILQLTIGILAVFFFPISADARQGSLERSQIARIDNAVAAEMERQNLVGVGIGVISDGNVAYCQGYGFAKREEKIEFTTKTVTNWASNSKPVVAVAALQLVEKGLLSLSESVRTYVPELPPAYQGITIRHLLCQPPFSPMNSTQFRSSRPFRQKQIPSSLAHWSSLRDLPG